MCCAVYRLGASACRRPGSARAAAADAREDLGLTGYQHGFTGVSRAYRGCIALYRGCYAIIARAISRLSRLCRDLSRLFRGCRTSGFTRLAAVSRRLRFAHVSRAKSHGWMEVCTSSLCDVPLGVMCASCSRPRFLFVSALRLISGMRLASAELDSQGLRSPLGNFSA